MTPKPLLTQRDLSIRWSMSPRTLEAYRWRGEGPAYVKIRGRILYRIEDVETYELANRVTPASAQMTSSAIVTAMSPRVRAS